ncbi:MAG: ABC transporter permease [Candidatus Hydrothermarchaeales archaeon]
MTSSLQFLTEGLLKALELIFSLDPYLLSVTKLSLMVSGTAILLSTLVGIPLAVFLALRNFKGKRLSLVVINTSMGLPPVVVGLVILLILIRSGPLGVLGLLYTPLAMIIAQFALATPIIIGVAVPAIASVERAIGDVALSLGGSKWDVAILSLKEARSGITTAVLAGFGRAIAEVGAILIVGGNIAFFELGHEVSYTRTLTTAITVETRKGDFSTAIALGLILISLAFTVNFALMIMKEARR